MNIKISEYEVPFRSHKLYGISVDDNDEIETLVTHDPGKVKTWINDIVKYLRKHRLPCLVVGLDVEWNPNKNDQVAILKLCIGQYCLVLQILHAPTLPVRLREFLGDSKYTFVGVGIEHNVTKLKDNYGLEVRNTKDLRSWAAQELNKEILQNSGLKELVQEVFGQEMKKPEDITLGRWDNHLLTTNQVASACLDAYFSFEIGMSLSKGM